VIALPCMLYSIAIGVAVLAAALVRRVPVHA
jgi:hypothetical protein